MTIIDELSEKLIFSVTTDKLPRTYHFRGSNSDVLEVLGKASEMTSSDYVPTNMSVGMETSFL